MMNYEYKTVYFSLGSISIDNERPQKIEAYLDKILNSYAQQGYEFVSITNTTPYDGVIVLGVDNKKICLN